MRLRILTFAAAALISLGIGFSISAQVAPPMGDPGMSDPPPRPAYPMPINVAPPLSDSKEFKAPPVRVISPGILEIDGVRVLKKERQVEIPCKVNMSRGLLEYLIVARAGKLHESLLQTDVQPASIQMALLLLGLEGTDKPLLHQGDPGKPKGDPVTIWVQWEEDGQTKKDRIEKWVMIVPAGGARMMPPPGTPRLPGKAMEPTDWTFTGSMITPNGMFMAQVEKSIVAIYHDPVALIDNPLSDGANNRIWFVNEGDTPPVGTDVTVFIRKAGDN